MENASRSFCVRLASARPMYWLKEELCWLTMLYCAMSATPFAFRPPPVPGFEAPTQLRSCLPRPVVSGDPIFSPLPGISMQLAVLKPALTQLTSLMLGLLGIDPANPRYLAAILPDGARA